MHHTYVQRILMTDDWLEQLTNSQSLTDSILLLKRDKVTSYIVNNTHINMPHNLPIFPYPQRAFHLSITLLVRYHSTYSRAIPLLKCGCRILRLKSMFPEQST